LRKISARTFSGSDASDSNGGCGGGGGGGALVDRRRRLIVAPMGNWGRWGRLLERPLLEWNVALGQRSNNDEMLTVLGVGCLQIRQNFPQMPL
jgi:hypothetical protein